LQTIGGLLLDLELRNGMDDISDMIAEEMPIEMEERVEETSEELKELVGDENDDRLIGEEIPEESEGLSEDEVLDRAPLCRGYTTLCDYNEENLGIKVATHEGGLHCRGTRQTFTSVLLPRGFVRVPGVVHNLTCEGARGF
jgi:hypothetical protein